MKPYDPLEYENLAGSVVQALFQRAEEPLPPKPSFEGSGVYAIYYRGKLDLYSKFTASEDPPPIYVGKAVPSGARKGGRQALGGRELHRRLTEHSKNIDQVENLALQDFTCRHLVVVPVWITLAERFLVEHFQPIWNVVIDGFGNHDPGAGRRGMKRPLWDILHPGRPWAGKLIPDQSVDDVLTRLNAFLDERN